MSFVISHPDVEGTAVIPERTLAVYAEKGWVLADRVDQPTPDQPAPHLTMPNRSDSAAKWKTYAVALGVANGGLTYEQAMAATRDELADKYRPAPTPEPKSAPAAKPKES